MRSTAYCLWARYELRGRAEAWEEALRALEAMFALPSAERTELDTHIRPREPYPVRGSGYMVDCLHSARWALERGSSYEQVVRLAVSLGNDTDTTACVAGGIAGIRYGLSGIPARWREALRGQALYQHLLEQLVDTASWITPPSTWSAYLGRKAPYNKQHGSFALSAW